MKRHLQLGAVDGNNIGYPYSNLSVDFVPPNHAEEFMDSCSGLLLLVKEYAKYFVCNPITKQCVAIPKLRACCNCSCPPIRFHAALAFDPCVSSHYRIVHFSLLDPRLAEIGIFSSCSGVWVLHRVPLGTSIPEFSFLRSNVYFDGMLYMISRSWKILCFDVNKVSFHVIELPDGMEKRGHRGCIGLSLGHLCYVRGDYPYMSLWSLDSSGGSYDWVLKHSLNIALLDQRFVYRARKFAYHHTWTVPCGIDPNSEAVFIGTSRQIVRYYIKTDKIEVVHETREDEVLSTWYRSVFTYTSCLVP